MLTDNRVAAPGYIFALELPQQHDNVKAPDPTCKWCDDPVVAKSSPYKKVILFNHWHYLVRKTPQELGAEK